MIETPTPGTLCWALHNDGEIAWAEIVAPRSDTWVCRIVGTRVDYEYMPGVLFESYADAEAALALRVLATGERRLLSPLTPR